jgi:hypothetical protein
MEKRGSVTLYFQCDSKLSKVWIRIRFEVNCRIRNIQSTYIPRILYIVSVHSSELGLPHPQVSVSPRRSQRNVVDLG